MGWVFIQKYVRVQGAPVGRHLWDQGQRTVPPSLIRQVLYPGEGVGVHDCGLTLCPIIPVVEHQKMLSDPIFNSIFHAGDPGWVGFPAQIQSWRTFPSKHLSLGCLELVGERSPASILFLHFQPFYCGFTNFVFDFLTIIGPFLHLRISSRISECCK